MRLLKLPDTVKTYVSEGKLSAGHARTLVTQEDPDRLAKAIIDAGMNVREAEALSRESDSVPKQKRTAPVEAKDADTRALEKQLADALGLAVEIRHKASGGGEIRIKYKTLEQLEGITGRLVR